MKKTYIDNGFWQISERQARALNNGKLPAHGREALIACEGQHYWLARTMHMSKQVWSIRETKWSLVNGQAVL